MLCHYACKEAVGHPIFLIPILEWGNFLLLLPMVMDLEALEAIQVMSGPATALLLAEGSYTPLNTPAWIEQLRPQVVLLSIAPGDRNRNCSLFSASERRPIGGARRHHGWEALLNPHLSRFVSFQKVGYFLLASQGFPE